ncbi:hypothetical protein [Streptomyces sp. Ru87]|uniref:hypothetical protein n=1 Tax=Streptomyces sp. Ru87 TaxID=2044307 RepID=UPI000BF4E0BD|nr:hypothetical protein [Streptomyces sp. Ru87]PGH49718.1 hypothetical protein CRI70_16355 [Streptomyces sp. Ru87]
MGEINEYAVMELDGDRDVSGPTADKTECEPLSDMLALGSEPEPSGRVLRMVFPVHDRGYLGLTVNMGLLAYEQGSAEAVLDGIRKAVDACADGFTDELMEELLAVERLPDAMAGEESVSCALISDRTGKRVPLNLDVVRSGSTLAVFYSTNLDVPQEGRAPAEVVAAQMRRLEKGTG